MKGYIIRLIEFTNNLLTGYILDNEFEETEMVKMKNVNSYLPTTKYIWVDNISAPLVIKDLQDALLTPKLKENYKNQNRFTMFNKFEKTSLDLYVDVITNNYLCLHHDYYCFLYKDEEENGKYNLLDYKALTKLKSSALKLKSIDRLIGYSYFENNNKELFKIKSNQFLLNNNYLLYGYHTKNHFKVVYSKDIIDADIKITHIYNHQSNFNAFCRAEFLKYPTSKRIPTEKLFISGTFPKIFKDDDFNVKGYWEKTKTGFVFKVLESERIFSSNLKVLKNFLLLSLKGNNIGKVTVNNIVEEHGLDTLNVIKNNHKVLSEIRGITEEKAEIIHNIILESDYIEEVMTYFVKNNIPLNIMMTLFEKYKLSTLELIKRNPYIILENKDISFKIADTLALNENIDYNDANRIKASILYYLNNDEQSNGNLYTLKNDLYDNIGQFILDEGVYKDKLDIDEIKPVLGVLKKDGIIVEEHLIEDYNVKCLYLSYNNFLENQIVKELKKLNNNMKPRHWDKEDIINCILLYEKQTGFKLAKKQKEAVIMTLLSGVSILTGGPGTGKTQTVNSIIHIFKMLKSSASIELAAPTGKASDRLTEITGLPATTIHRKLKYIPFNGDVELLEIDCDLLVIDEASMIDADLFYKLLSNISDRTRVLFVGDHNQIPSVGAGLILRDLINSYEVPTTKLDEIFRQDEDSTIVLTAHDVINGITTDKGLNLNDAKDFKFIRSSNPVNIKNNILDIVEKELQEYNLNDIQVLTPMNVGDLGTNILNYELQDKFNPYTESKNEIRLGPTKILRVLDKVIQTKNNYEIEVFNGSLGNIIKIDKDTKTPAQVEYDLNDVDYSYADLEDLMLAYAMTIHKSQGSEFKVVIIPIHSSHLFMNNKNLLYTAITRAKEKVYLVGEEDILNAIISKEDHIKRNSQIVSKLKGKKTQIPF